MGQATRRELALGLWIAEASPAATRDRSRWRRGGAGARENQRHIQKDAAEEADMQRGVEEAEANMQRIKVMNALHTQGGAE
jgi:hypothetical protein